MDEEALMQAVAGGDARAFERLVKTYQQPLVRFAARLLGDADAAQDAVQEAFLHLWRTRARYECRNSLRAFLFRVVRNVCWDRRRAHRVTESLGEDQGGGQDMEETIQTRALSGAVRGAVQQLPEAQRTVFILSQYEGLSYAEIAQVVDCPVGTVASRRRLALEALRRDLRAWIEPRKEGRTQDDL